MKFLRATRKLRAECVGAGGGPCSEKPGLESEMVCVVSRHPPNGQGGCHRGSWGWVQRKRASFVVVGP